MKSKTTFMLKVVMLMAASALIQPVILHAQEKGKPWPAPESAVKMKNPNPASAQDITDGKALYAKHCKSCHGSGGKGDGPKAANLDISCGDFTSDEFKKETEGGIYWKTTEGRDPMPTFKKKMSDDERWQVVSYIRSLSEKK